MWSVQTKCIYYKRSNWLLSISENGLIEVFEIRESIQKLWGQKTGELTISAAMLLDDSELIWGECMNSFSLIYMVIQVLLREIYNGYTLSGMKKKSYNRHLTPIMLQGSKVSIFVDYVQKKQISSVPHLYYTVCSIIPRWCYQLLEHRALYSP